MAEMHTTLVNLLGDTIAPKANIRTITRGRFISLDISSHFGFILPGFDADAATAARAIATALTTAADEMERAK